MTKNQSSYFDKLNAILKKYHRAIPCLLIDLDRLDKNIETLKKNINKDTNFRLVIKSVPSMGLIEYILKSMETFDLMLFHQPFLSDLSARLDERSDILLGKPFPVKTAQFYYENLPQNTNNFNPFTQIQWLVDTSLRMQEYIDLAKKLDKKLRLNLELDVGLRRGGFQNLEDLRKALKLMQENQNFVEFSGLMGYDPHVVKLPRIIRSQKKALKLSNNFYLRSKTLIQKEFPILWKDKLTFNGSGSPTVNLHQKEISPLNDISAGSCLVMPSTFDILTLEVYKPACFIASPVLKKLKGTTLPALEKVKNLFNLLSSTYQQSYFIYGGLWKADYCYPKGIKQNSFFKSTNQNMLNAPKSVKLEVDDFVFLRPQQSEFVFLQFGEILPFRNDEILGSWDLLKNY